MSLIKKIIAYLLFFAKYYILYGGNKVHYLRSLGAKIGTNCDLIMSINNFGSEPYLIRLGNNVTVTEGVMFLTHDGGTRVFRGVEKDWQIGMGLYGAIEIGDNVFIGVNSIIMPGVKIGNSSLIGAGSIVTKDVPSGVVAAGNPARILSVLESYKKHALENSLNIDISSKQAKREDLVKHFWLDKQK